MNRYTFWVSLRVFWIGLNYFNFFLFLIISFHTLWINNYHNIFLHRCGEKVNICQINFIYTSYCNSQTFSVLKIDFIYHVYRINHVYTISVKTFSHYKVNISQFHNIRITPLSKLNACIISYSLIALSGLFIKEKGIWFASGLGSN